MLPRFALAFVGAISATAHAGVIEKVAALPEPGTVSLTLAGLVLIIGLMRGNK